LKPLLPLLQDARPTFHIRRALSTGVLSLVYPELTFFLSCLTVQKDPTREENVEVKAKGGNTYAEITESIKDSFQIAGRSFQAGGADFKAGR
jgi:hypothetical protein